MSFFDFFSRGNSKTSGQSDDQQDPLFDSNQEIPNVNIPSEDLFVDNSPPTKINEVESELSIFLNRRYDTIGQTDGYFQHSNEYLLKAKKKLIGEFLLCVDMRIDELGVQLSKIKNIIIDVQSLSQPNVEKLQERVNTIREQIEKLKKEKELAFEHGGMIFSVISQYEAGYEQGMNDYIKEEIFLNPLKSI